MAETYKLPEVPASISSALNTLHNKALEAERVERNALAEIKTITETFYGLIGKLVVYREQQHRREMTYTLLVTRISCDSAGHLRWIGGNIQTKEDLKAGHKRVYGVEKRASRGDIAEGRVTVVDDAGA